MEPTNNYDRYNLLEEQILSKIEELTKANFGDQEVVYGPNDPRAQEITRVANELLKEFPSDDRGNRFLGSHLILQPLIVVSVTDLRPILSKEEPSSLFPQETGKIINVPSIENEQFGKLVDGNDLVIRNIRIPTGQAIHNYEIDESTNTKPQPPIANAVRINKKITHDTPGKVKIVADIIFGEHKLNDFEFEAEFNEATQETLYRIPLPKITGKINHDRSVQLSNGVNGMLENFGINCQGATCIKSPIIVGLPIRLPLPDLIE